jgi:uncharacterized protein YgiM (DUF1202 family)
MKTNHWILLGAMLSTSLLAEQAPPAQPLETPAAAPAITNVPPAGSTEASKTNAPASKKKSSKKKTEKPSAKQKSPGSELKTVPLVAGPAVVAANHVNVRGQAKLNSEIVTRLTNGQPVTVIEEITHKNSGPDEPSAWAKIVLPPNAHLWLNGTFLDANKAVKPKKLNLRAGPGENYSVLGQLQRGDTVNQLNAKGDWLEIDPPTNAYAFVAAQYLKQEVNAAPTTTPTEPTTPATVTEAPVIAATTVDTNAPPETAPTNAVAEATITNAPPAADEPPTKRIVQREGLVRGTFSIQAPTHYELISADNGKTIDYLYTTSPMLDLSRYKGLRIIVTGEEGLEERWGNTPVITIQKIQVIE